MEKNIINYDLPRAEITDYDSLGKREVDGELNITPPENLIATSNLITEQETTYINIIDRINTNRDGVFFIDGPGGTGKT